MTKFFQKLFEQHLILIWSIIIILFIVVIHSLFSIESPHKWLIATWSSGDILTFIGTVSLGLLAIWQNKSLQKTNEKSQERMESLAKKSNELAIMSKIIEYETARLNDLKLKTKNFLDATNTATINEVLSDVSQQVATFRKLYVKIKVEYQNKQIKLCAIELLSELNNYANDEKVLCLIEEMSKYANLAEKLNKTVLEHTATEATFKEKIKFEISFTNDIYNFISARTSFINKIISGHLTYEQIKNIYNSN